jgi:queuine tRNA-ribosyltransferase
LLAVVQGGSCRDLRRRCAEALAQIGFDGYGFGGWPVDDAGRLVDAVAMTAELIAPDRPKWALGIGKPEHVVAAAAMGYDLFDCVIPTRDARHSRLYAFLPGRDLALEGPFYEPVYITDDRYIRDGRPIEAGCDCLTCTRYSRSYLHHLFHVRETLAQRLATVHNLRFYARLMERLREQRRRHV